MVGEAGAMQGVRRHVGTLGNRTSRSMSEIGARVPEVFTTKSGGIVAGVI